MNLSVAFLTVGVLQFFDACFKQKYYFFGGSLLRVGLSFMFYCNWYHFSRIKALRIPEV